jgi:hypothetical protein
MCRSHGIAQSAHFRQVAGSRVQQGRIGLEEVGSQVVIPYVLVLGLAWLQVVALFKSRVCGQPIHRASATVRTPPLQCAQSNRVSRNWVVVHLLKRQKKLAGVSKISIRWIHVTKILVATGGFCRTATPINSWSGLLDTAQRGCLLVQMANNFDWKLAKNLVPEGFPP